MEADARDESWNVVFETFYDAYYEERVADALRNRWQSVDHIISFLVALTASGSAVAGWTLWSQPQFRTAWAVLAGVAAVLAIVHKTVGVPSRIKDWSDTYSCFAALRVDLESLRQRMRVGFEFSVKRISEDHDKFRERFRHGIERREADPLRTRTLRDKTAVELNESLGDAIVRE